MLEVLGEIGDLCTARTVEMSSSDIILCTRRGRALRLGDLPGFKRAKSDGVPGGWHLAGASIWSYAGVACTPHAAV
ncbi:hypothetical protein ABZ299_20090 [Streptomyces sp. NPDC006184]|uniref:hypothetical protein n=1 Tax=Streptomyces sp. NPDC006184 TaxID=3155455 RepID=UPI0033BB05D6